MSSFVLLKNKKTKNIILIIQNIREPRKSTKIRSSEKERMVDALALDADEGRDKLRKATGSRK